MVHQEISSMLDVPAIASFFMSKKEEVKNQKPNEFFNRGPRSQAHQRAYSATISAQDKPTPLNFKKIAVTVTDGLVKEGGLFAASYISYRVITDPLRYDVRRRDSDFGLLRKILARQFPNIVVAPCSGVPPVKNVPKLIEKRERYYSRFIQAIVRSEELKTSQFFLDFLYEQDAKNWAKIIKDANEKIKTPKSLEEYTTVNG